MNQFERDLRESLRRRDPPGDFAAKVLARTRETEVRSVFSWRWLAIAALVVLMVGGSLFIQKQQRQVENERTKQQLMAALRITGAKVKEVQDRLDAIHERIGRLQGIQ